MNLPMKSVLIHEVGMRDGLQMEKETVPFEKKVEWIRRLAKTGVDIIQLGSFVHPVKVPQMVDTDSLFQYFNKPENKPPNVLLSGLVLNEKGLERGLACGVELFCMGVSASETHSQKNTGMSVEESLRRTIATAKQARSAGKHVQVSVQSAFGCGFEGYIPPERVVNIVSKYLEAGLKNISLADTAGHGTPDDVTRLYEAVLKLDSSIECASHFHNTYGMGLANCYAALKLGVRCFEAAFAGLGGCPFTKTAGGNICTEDLVHYLHRIGSRNDIDLDKLVAHAKDVRVYFDREMPGMVYKTGGIKWHLK
jgi:hydroxymethylglutaryl-CoA lyase